MKKEEKRRGDKDEDGGKRDASVLLKGLNCTRREGNEERSKEQILSTTNKKMNDDGNLWLAKKY